MKRQNVYAARRFVVVLLVAVLLTSAFAKRARSSRSHWSLITRVPKQELTSLVASFRGRSRPEIAIHDGSNVHSREDAASSQLLGEFEPQQGLLLSGHLAESSQGVFCDIVSAVPQTTRIVTIVQDAEQREFVLGILKNRQIERDDIMLVRATHDSQWVRDYVPMPLFSRLTPRPVFVERYSQRDRFQLADDGLTRIGFTVVHHDFSCDGGNLLTNGEGLCLTTSALLNANPGWSAADLEASLASAFGVRQLVVLEPLDGESTGHVDMFATFTDPRTVVVGSYPRFLDPENAAILHKNAMKLQRVRTPSGNLRVVRVPMPPNLDEVWRTYTNVVYANGVLLLPTYSNAERAERDAIQIFQQQLPGWKIARINVDHLMKNGGALHCVVMNLGFLDPPEDWDIEDWDILER